MAELESDHFHPLHHPADAANFTSGDHHHEQHHHDHHEEMEHMMRMVEKVKEPTTIEHLIKSLSHKLRTLNGEEELPSSNHTDFVGGLEEVHQDHHHDQEYHVHEKKAKGNPIFHEDTITLLASCVFMIILGLALRKLFLYLAHIKQTKRRHRGALRQFAEHMHVVTRTISNPPASESKRGTPVGTPVGTPIPGSPIPGGARTPMGAVAGAIPGSPIPGTPRSLRSARVAPLPMQHVSRPLPPSPLVTHNRTTTETSFFKPSTHTMVLSPGANDEGVNCLMTQLEARRVSRMQNFLNNQD